MQLIALFCMQVSALSQERLVLAKSYIPRIKTGEVAALEARKPGVKINCFWWLEASALTVRVKSSRTSAGCRRDHKATACLALLEIIADLLL
jgi:hypothetical protein